MVSDLTFAIMPMFFTWKLKRSLIERALVSLLLSLGLCAAATVAVRLHYLIEYNESTQDTFRKTALLFTWCRIEECVLIVAACTPFLKSPIERILVRLNVPTFRDTTGGLNLVHTVGGISNTRDRYGISEMGQSQVVKQVEGHDDLRRDFE
jgi:hypothetical protein